MIRALVAATLFLIVGGCDESPPAHPSPDATYQVRGEIRGVTDGAERFLSIHHEAIDDFRDREGVVVGMRAMTMMFQVADGVALSGVDVGDAVSITFEVRWSGGSELQITALEELPADTVLELGGGGSADHSRDSR